MRRSRAHRLASLARWEIVQLRPKQVSEEFDCSDYEAAQLLVRAYRHAYRRSARICPPGSAARQLLSKEQTFLEALTRLMEHQSLLRTSTAFCRSAWEMARSLAALDLLSSDFKRYTHRLIQVASWAASMSAPPTGAES